MFRFVMKFSILLGLAACSGSGQQTTDGGLTASAEFSDAELSLARELGCHRLIKPGDSFAHALYNMDSGQLLCLADGEYSQVLNIPDEMHVRALHDGMAVISGHDVNAGWKGLLMLTGENASVRGLKVHHASYNAKACLIGGENNRFSNMSCSHGGGYKHAIPLAVSGSGHLIENSWFYGEGRYLLMCYMGDNIEIRNNVFRWDKTTPNQPNEPNAAMSNYSCTNTLWENNISLDYGAPETFMKHCGDICMSTTFDQPNENVRFFGNIVINHDPSTGNNVGLRADQKSAGASNNILIRDFVATGTKVGIAVNPKYQNVNVENCKIQSSKMNVFVKDKQFACNDDVQLNYRYLNGELSTESLWPWPNQELIKRDMCAQDERQSDWCKTDLTLTDYVIMQINSVSPPNLSQ